MKKIAIVVMAAAVVNLFGDIATVQKLIEKQKYQEAIEAAQASKQDYPNPKLHLLWAKACEKIGDRVCQMSALERASMLDPKILTPSQRTTLERLHNGASFQNTTWKSSIDAQIGYDTNVNIAPDELGSSNTQGKLDTLFFVLSAQMSYRNELEKKNGWYVRADGGFYNQNNFDNAAKDYDMFHGIIQGGVGYSKPAAYDLYLPLIYGYLHYLDTGLFNKYAIAPQLRIFIDKRAFVNLSLNYEYRDYIDTMYNGNDQQKAAAAFSLYKFVPKGFLYASLSYENFSSTHTLSNLYIDRDNVIGLFGGEYRVASNIRVRFDERLRYSLYKDKAQNGEKREDHFSQTQLKCSYDITKRLDLYASGRYVVSKTNDTRFEYSKTIATVGIGYNY